MDESELRRRLYVDDYEQWARQCSRKYFSDRRKGRRPPHESAATPFFIFIRDSKTLWSIEEKAASAHFDSGDALFLFIFLKRDR